MITAVSKRKCRALQQVYVPNEVVSRLIAPETNLVAGCADITHKGIRWHIGCNDSYGVILGRFLPKPIHPA